MFRAKWKSLGLNENNLKDYRKKYSLIQKLVLLLNKLMVLEKYVLNFNAEAKVVAFVLYILTLRFTKRFILLLHILKIRKIIFQKLKNELRELVNVLENQLK